MNRFVLLALTLFVAFTIKAQQTFEYTLQLQPVVVPGLGGLHSYAFAQADGKWLLIGGRTDGLHPRQPFNSFPESDNNTNIFVVDVEAGQYWSAPVTSLSTGLQEQLQATNMNFFQDEDTLYIVGGYSFSATANDHITFPNLTTVQVSELMDAIINNQSITPYFKQITDSAFAVTGAQLNKLDGTFYLIGGHKFDGRYNPMGHATYTQTYTNQIRKFTVDNSGSQLSFANYTTITDPVHLHRRDYNLMPQIFPDGTPGFTISSGVFQVNVDLPYLYPVDITATGHTPITTFNQYLSNYHSAAISMYDSVANQMHNFFFGGMSRYYYSNDSLIQDDLVPFVKTISRVTRNADGTLQEYQLPIEMPGLKGSSAEFIINPDLPAYEHEVLKMSSFGADTVLLGHIYGGITSSSLNPFSVNQTNLTAADTTIYAVYLVKTTSTGEHLIEGVNGYEFEVYPNPVSDEMKLHYQMQKKTDVVYYITGADGKLWKQGTLTDNTAGQNEQIIKLPANIPAQTLMVTLIFDQKYFVTRKVTKQ